MFSGTILYKDVRVRSIYYSIYQQRNSDDYIAHLHFCRGWQDQDAATVLRDIDKILSAKRISQLLIYADLFGGRGSQSSIPMFVDQLGAIVNNYGSKGTFVVSGAGSFVLTALNASCYQDKIWFFETEIQVKTTLSKWFIQDTWKTS